jgi:hypothetical protein
MKTLHILVVCCAAAAISPASTVAKPAEIQASTIAVLPSYASTAKLVVAAPMIIDARIRSVVKIKGAEAAGLAAGYVRYYVEADVLALIRGAGTVAPRVGYVADVPLGARGREPKLRKQRVLLFARPVPGRTDQLHLTGLDGQQLYSAEYDALVRAIAKDAIAADAPPAITGVGNAFHVPGTLPGEGETQVFLQTAGGAPVSLQVLRRPGEQKRWSVSLGDIVDESAGPPARDTFLWYRLACGLPRDLPAASLEAADPGQATLAREDYAFVINALGPCA